MLSQNTDCSDETSTNVQVTLRVKPRSDKESVILEIPEEPQMVAAVDKPFIFDHVAWEGSSQEEVYNLAAKNLVAKALQGYNGTILAYGQTGTGKTYTMGSASSSAIDPSKTGLTHRCLTRIFEQSDIHVSASFMEIYNEELHDLLNTRVKLTMRNGVPTPRVQPILTFEEGVNVIENALKFRQTTWTKLNSASSRSHALLTLYLKIQDGDKLTESKLNLVDLAGSESIKKTQAQGLAFLEGRNINQSLLALSSVIAALSKNTTTLHVPYRNSVLTSTLQDSLGGKSLISLVACVSPDPKDLCESVNTMRFAERAKMVKTKPDLNVVLTNFLERNKVEVKRLSMVVSPSGQDSSSVGGQTSASKRRMNLSASASKKPKFSLKTPETAIPIAKSTKNNLQTPLKFENGILTLTERDGALRCPLNGKNALPMRDKSNAFLTPAMKAVRRSRMKDAALLSLNKENRIVPKEIDSLIKGPRLTMQNKKNALLDAALDDLDMSESRSALVTKENNLEVFVMKLDKQTNVLRDATNFAKTPKTPIVDKAHGKLPLSSSKTPIQTKNAMNDEYTVLLNMEKTIDCMQSKLDHMAQTIVRTKSLCSRMSAKETKNDNESPFNNFKVPKLPIPRPRRSMLRPSQSKSCSMLATPKADRKISARKCLTMETDPNCENDETIPTKEDCEKSFAHGGSCKLLEGPPASRRRSARLILKRKSNNFETAPPENASNDNKRRSGLILGKPSAAKDVPSNVENNEPDRQSELKAPDHRSLQIDDAAEFTSTRASAGKINVELPEQRKNERGRRRSARISIRRQTMYVPQFQDVAVPRGFDDVPSNGNDVSFQTRNRDERSELEAADRHNPQIDAAAELISDKNFGGFEQNRRRSVRLSIRRQTMHASTEEDFAVPKNKKRKDVAKRRLLGPEDDERPIQSKILSEKQVAHNRKILGILNEGNLGQLKTLARIGPKTANVLHEYRDLNGKFRSFDDLTNVAGWTKAFVNRLLLANNVVLE